MKLKHTITQDGCTLSGKILEKWVYVSDKSEEDALNKKVKRKLLFDAGKDYLNRFLCKDGLCNELVTSWQYAVPVPPASEKNSDK